MIEAEPVSKSEKNTVGPNRTSELLERPTRPLSAYNLFFRDQRQALIQTLPAQKASRSRYSRKRQSHHKISFSDMGKVIGTRWKSIDPASLAIYESRAIEEKRKYTIALEAWRKQQEALGLPTTKQQKKRKETPQGHSKPNKKQRGPALAQNKALQHCPTMDDLEPLEFNPTLPDTALLALPPEARKQDVMPESKIEPLDVFGDAPCFSMHTDMDSTTMPTLAPNPNGPHEMFHESNQVGAMGYFAHNDDHIHGYTPLVGQGGDTSCRAFAWAFSPPYAPFPNQVGNHCAVENPRHFWNRVDDLDPAPSRSAGASVRGGSISLPSPVNPAPIPSWSFGDSSGQVSTTHSSAGTHNNCPRQTFLSPHSGL